MKLLLPLASLLTFALLLVAGAYALSGPVPQEMDCASRQVALDEGYGVTRIETRDTCSH